MNRKILLAIVIVALVIAAGAMSLYHWHSLRSVENETTTENGDFRTYTNEEYGFSFSYPGTLEINQSNSDFEGKSGKVYISFNSDNQGFYSVSFLNCAKWDAYMKQNNITDDILPFYNCHQSQKRYQDYLKKSVNEYGHQIKKTNAALPFVSYARFNPESAQYEITYLAFKNDTEIKFLHRIDRCINECPTEMPSEERIRDISNQIINLNLSDPQIVFELKTIQSMINTFSIAD